MKLYRVLALALAIVMMGCVMVACDEKEPEEPTKSLTVKIAIKDGEDGEVIVQDTAYKYIYKGDKQPTVMDVLLDYCSYEEMTVEFQDEDQKYIKKIGSCTAGTGKFWAYSQNKVTDKDEPMYEQVVADGDVLIIYLATTSKD